MQDLIAGGVVLSVFLYVINKVLRGFFSRDSGPGTGCSRCGTKCPFSLDCSGVEKKPGSGGGSVE